MWSTGKLNLSSKPTTPAKRVSFKKDIEETITFKNDKKQIQAQIILAAIHKSIISKKLTAFIRFIGKAKTHSTCKVAVQYLAFIMKSKQLLLKRSAINQIKALRIKQVYGANLLKKLNQLDARKKIEMKKMLFAKVAEIQFRQRVKKGLKEKSKSQIGSLNESKKQLPILREKADQAIDGYFEMKNVYRNKSLAKKINCEEIQNLIKENQQKKLFTISQTLQKVLQKLIKYDKNIYTEQLYTQLRETLTQELKNMEKQKILYKIPKNNLNQVQIFIKVLQNHIKYTLEITHQLKMNQSKQTKQVKLSEDYEALKKLKLINNSKQIRQKQYKKMKQLITLSIESGNQTQVKTNITNLLRRFTQVQYKQQLTVYETLNNFIIQNEQICKSLETSNKIIQKLGDIRLKVDSSLSLNSIRANKKECLMLINKNSAQGQSYVLGLLKNVDKFYIELAAFLQSKETESINLSKSGSQTKNLNLSMEKYRKTQQDQSLVTKYNQLSKELEQLKKEFKQKNRIAYQLNVKLNQTEKIKNKLEEKIISLHQVQKQLTSKILEIQSNNTQLISENHQLKKDLTLNQNTINSLQNKITQTQQINFNYISSQKQQLIQIANLENRAQQLKTRIKLLNDANSQLAKTNQKIKEQKKDAELGTQTIFQAYEKQTKKNKQLLNQIQTLIQTNKHLNQFIQEEQKRTKQLEEQITPITAQYQNRQPNISENMLLFDHLDEVENTTLIKDEDINKQQQRIKLAQEFKRLEGQFFQLKQENLNLKKIINNSKEDNYSLENLQKTIESENQRLNYLLKQKNEQKEQMYQIIYNLTDQLQKARTIQQFNQIQEKNYIINNLKNQLNELKQNHSRIVEEEVLKAIRIQEKEINQFLKQNDKERDAFYQNVIIPERKRFWEISMQKEISYIVNSQRQIWQQQWLKKQQPLKILQQNPQK